MKLQTILLFFAIGFASLHAQEGKAPAAEEKPAPAQDRDLHCRPHMIRGATLPPGRVGAKLPA